MADQSLPHSGADLLQAVSAFALRLRIAHQIAGRVRFRLADPQARFPDGARLKAALAAAPGVREVSLNPLARSCVVEYDNAIIPDAAWPDLLAGRRTPAAAMLLDLLAAAIASRPLHTRQKEETS